MSGFERSTPFTGAAPLSPTDLALVGQIVNECVEHVRFSLPQKEATSAHLFLVSVTRQHTPYLLVAPNGFAKIMNDVFSDADVVDFVFTLHFQIGARISGLIPNVIDSLAANLAQGLAPVRPGNSNGAPQAVADRLVSSQEAYNLLVANPWLVIVLLLQLFIRIELPKA